MYETFYIYEFGFIMRYECERRCMHEHWTRRHKIWEWKWWNWFECLAQLSIFHAFQFPMIRIRILKHRFRIRNEVDSLAFYFSPFFLYTERRNVFSNIKVNIKNNKRAFIASEIYRLLIKNKILSRYFSSYGVPAEGVQDSPDRLFRWDLDFMWCFLTLR